MRCYSLISLNLGCLSSQKVKYPAPSFRKYLFIDGQILQFIHHSNQIIFNSKISNFEEMFAFVFSGRAKCGHEHSSTLLFLFPNHSPLFPVEQRFTPIHTLRKCALIIPRLIYM